MRTEARFPALDEGAGHYESFYLKAAAPEGGRAVWIRHTVHKRPGAAPTCSVWFVLFDSARGAPAAGKQTFEADRLSTPEGGYVSVAGAEIAPGRAEGSIACEGLEAEWRLRFADRHEPLHHLPSGWMYRRGLPRTKLLSPHPAALFEGEVALGGERVSLEGWPGMVGHNWGSEHAERWVWIQASDFEGGEPGDYLDIAAGRVKLGPLTTPWVPNGRLVLGGEELQLGGLGRSYGTEILAEPTGCEFVVAGKGVTVKGRVGAPAESFVGWIYANPKGDEHHTLNCSICDLELRVERPGKKHAHLRLEGGAAYEVGMRERDHGVPIQPFPDG